MTTTLLLFVRKHWPALAAFLVMLGLVCWAYLQGVANGKTERTAYYEAILAERDRASARRWPTPWHPPRPRQPKPWRPNVPTCRPRPRPSSSSEP